MRDYNKYKKYFKKRKKLTPLQITIIMVIALITMGLGYAAFVDTIQITGEANIGGFTIEYVLNGGTNTPNPITNYDATTNGLLPIPSYDNHFFVGWYDNSDFLGTALTRTPTRKRCKRFSIIC